MELIDYIDSDEGRDDVTASVAVNVCENCGATCDTLIDLPGWNFKACETCALEAAREDARQAAELRKPCVNCKTRLSRWDSIYCSDRCKKAFLYFRRLRNMTKREIEIYLERINKRMVRAYGRELQPLEREAVRRDVEEFYAKRIPGKKKTK